MVAKGMAVISVTWNDKGAGGESRAFHAEIYVSQNTALTTSCRSTAQYVLPSK